MHKYVYLFSEGNGSMRELLGGKGANLAEMTNLGMPVPQGFTISTEACTKYYEDDRNINDEIKAQVYEALARIEKINGKKFGDAKNPLLVSVRSGARASMPGMMDTILNLGLNDEVAAGLIAGNPTPAFTRFVYDSYRRFIQMFSDVVMELSKKTFEVIIDEVKAAKGVKNDIDLDADDMKKLVDLFKDHYKEEKGEDFPTDPAVQLMERDGVTPDEVRGFAVLQGHFTPDTPLANYPADYVTGLIVPQWDAVKAKVAEYRAAEDVPFN